MDRFVWFLAGVAVGALGVLVLQSQDEVDPEDLELDVVKKGDMVEALAAHFSSN